MKYFFYRYHLFALLWIILSAGLWNTTAAQNTEVKFPASQLREVTIKYTGTAVNWPIVADLANHNVSENRFYLGSEEILRLSNFGRISQQVNQLQERISGLVQSGATIFAKEQLTQANELVTSYHQAIKQGDIATASGLAEELADKVSELDSTVSANRMVNIQAELQQKEGDVDKRRGLLGSWVEALVGDLFHESDGIKTYAESYARLAFVDGSEVVVDPQTVAIIRQSRIDKLNKRVDTEISLEDGGLLAKLSASGKEQGNYVLQAGGSSTDLETQRFYAERDTESRVRLSNYDGMAFVNSNDITVAIGKDEGTVVQQGRAPIPPVELIPPPELTWNSPDSVMYSESLLVSFLPREQAQSYVVQTSSSRNFDENVNSYQTSQPSVMLSGLDLGITYLRVQSVDSLGLRGPFSSNFRIIRNKDTQPPPVFLGNITDETIYTTESSITVRGTSEPGVEITVNGDLTPVSNDGSFSTTVSLPDRQTPVEISAVDGSGNRTNRKLTVINIDPESLFNNIKWNGTRSGNSIQPKTKGLALSGVAYPGFEIQAQSGEVSKSVRTDLSGRWGVSIESPGKQITLSFIDLSTGNQVATKSFTITNNQ